MELKRAVELYTEYNGTEGQVRINKEGYFCLNELASFFPSKRLDHWLCNDATKELIKAVEKNIIPGMSGIIAKKGKGGGTWAHELIALDFAAWLSIDFKLHIYQIYLSKKNWSFKRELAANNYKVMCEAIHDAHTPAKFYHYSNEALLLNEIVFGVRDAAVRDGATEEQLNYISKLEMHNSTLIGLGTEYEERKQILIEFYNKMKQKAIPE